MPAGDRARLDVTMGHGRWKDRSGTSLTLLMHWLRAFDDAPTVIRAALDVVDHLPHSPADVADPERAVGWFERHLPRIAEAVGPDFTAGTRVSDERIVRWYAIGEARIVMINVDPENRSFEIADVLTAV